MQACCLLAEAWPTWCERTVRQCCHWPGGRGTLQQEQLHSSATPAARPPPPLTPRAPSPTRPLRRCSGAVKLFADFFDSDIIVASPIALATRLAEAGDDGAADFLSSVEILVAERADVMLMQNWAHVATGEAAWGKEAALLTDPQSRAGGRLGAAGRRLCCCFACGRRAAGGIGEGVGRCLAHGLQAGHLLGCRSLPALPFPALPPPPRLQCSTPSTESPRTAMGWT